MSRYYSPQSSGDVFPVPVVFVPAGQLVHNKCLMSRYYSPRSSGDMCPVPVVVVPVGQLVQ